MSLFVEGQRSWFSLGRSTGSSHAGRPPTLDGNRCRRSAFASLALRTKPRSQGELLRDNVRSSPAAKSCEISDASESDSSDMM